jgi:hypothetical protein
MARAPEDVSARFRRAVRKYPVEKRATTGGAVAAYEWCRAVQEAAGAVYRMGYYGPIDGRLEAATRRLVGGEIPAVVTTLASQPGRASSLDEWGYAVRSWVARQADRDGALDAVVGMLVGVAAEILDAGGHLACRGEARYWFVRADGRHAVNRASLDEVSRRLGRGEPAPGGDWMEHMLWSDRAEDPQSCGVAGHDEWMHPDEAETHAAYIGRVTGYAVTPVVIGQSPRVEAAD